MSEAQIQPGITFLNSTGDITISWDKDKESEILALVQKKMDAGFTFFLLKPRFGGLFGKKKVAEEDVNKIREAGYVVAPDALAKDVVMKLGDEDLSALVSQGKAVVVSSEKKTEVDTIGRAKSAAEVVANQSIAIKPITGG